MARAEKKSQNNEFCDRGEKPRKCALLRRLLRLMTAYQQALSSAAAWVCRSDRLWP